MGIGFAGKEGARLGMARALTFGAAKAQAVLRLAFHIVWRVLLFALPFVVAVGAIYWFLLHDHDINYYLAHKPPVFWGAVMIILSLIPMIGGALIWVPAAIFILMAPTIPIYASAHHLYLPSIGGVLLITTLIVVPGSPLRGLIHTPNPVKTTGILITKGKYSLDWPV